METGNHAPPADPFAAPAELPSPEEMIAALMGNTKRGAHTALERTEAPQMPSTRPPKIRYSHEGMIDLILTNPWISQNQLAAHYGRTPAWISTIMTSDAFKAQLNQRRQELIDPELRLTIEERFRALTTKSLQVLQEKLAKPVGEVPDNLALKTLELGAKALGIGGNSQQQTVLVTSEDRLEKLASRLVALRGGRSGQVIDMETQEIQ